MSSQYSKSSSFKQAMKRASRIAGNPEQLERLLSKLGHKLNNFDDFKGELRGLLEKVKLFGRMIRSFAKGEYREIPWKSVILIVSALIYFLTPIDFVPDFIPLFGFMDDASIVLWIFTSLQEDIQRFNAYERSRMVSDAEVVEDANNEEEIEE